MTAAADRLFVNGEIHSLTEPDETYAAVAVRDGRIVRLGRTHDVAFLEGIDTDVIDLDGRVLLPGFIDAHTHLTTVGRYLVHADLSAATSPDDAVSLLAARAAEIGSTDPDENESTDPDENESTASADTPADDWVLGYGYDESTWGDSRYLTRSDLDRVSTDRPVAAFREDMHVAAVNGVGFDRVSDALAVCPDETVPTKADTPFAEGGEPTGVLLESAIDPVYEAVEPDLAATREVISAALADCATNGITGFHDMVRNSHAPRVYRELDAHGELTARVRINYWSTHLDALREVGLTTNDGDEFVQTGAIKSYTDGSFGGRTAKLSEPYADAPQESGQWVVEPAALESVVADATAAGYQFTAHAIGDEAIDAVLDAYEHSAVGSSTSAARHRIEHVELASDEAISRLADSGAVASVQPNFLKWAGPDGLYDARIGERRTETNRYRDLLESGVHLAFGSDGMPMDPLLGVHYAVNAPADTQRLTVTDALRAYTLGSAYAGFDADRLGTIEPDKRADFVALDSSPWESPESIRDIGVAMTVVNGDVVYDGRTAGSADSASDHDAS